MKQQDYKGNRPSSEQLDLNYHKRQLRTMEETLARWKCINNELLEKGKESRHSQDKIQRMENEINAKRFAIEKISANI